MPFARRLVLRTSLAPALFSHQANAQDALIRGPDPLVPTEPV
jgi:hypothetical protein